MSTPMNAIVTGSFTSAGAIVNLTIPSGYTQIDLYNTTDLASASNTDVMLASGTSLMPSASAYYSVGSGASSTLTPKFTSTGGFTFVSDSAQLTIGGSVSLTAINQANPAVVSSGTTTGLVASSSVVRLFNTTGMLQVAGMDFTVGTISAGVSFQLKYLDSSGFGAAATAGTYRIINATDRFYPKSRYITKITAANPAVVTLSVTHGYTVGQAVRFIVPSAFGMTQINGLIGNITAISTTNNTITVDIDSSSFSAFAFPTSATAATGVTFAQVVPVGEAAINSSTQAYGNLLDDATHNVSFTGVQVGTTVQTSGQTYQWVARKGVSI